MPGHPHLTTHPIPAPQPLRLASENPKIPRTLFQWSDKRLSSHPRYNSAHVSTHSTLPVHPAALEIYPVSNQDSPRLRRLLRLIFRLSQTPLGLPVADIAEAEGCTERTCRRDLLLLRKIGLPLQEHSGEHNRKYWRIAPRVQNLKFSLFELLSLYMGRRLLEPFAGTPFFEGIHTVFQRLESQLFSGAALFQAQLAEVFYLSSPGSSDYSTRAQLIDLLLQAVQQRRTLLMDYRKPGEVAAAQYRIQPWSLAAHHGSLYIIAWSEYAQDVRHFKVDRIEALQLLHKKFQVPDSFSVQAWLEGSFGLFSPENRSYRIEIEFYGSAAETVQESRWHPNQKFTTKPDGRTVMSLNLRSLHEIKSWVLSFGSQARVLKPSLLVRKVREELQATAKLYRRKNGKHEN